MASKINTPTFDSLEESQTLFQRRLLAVLEYDGVPKHRRAAFLVKAGKMSRSTAYRLLNGSPAASICHISLDLMRALEVDCDWLWLGKFSHFDVRTMRIHIQTYKGYSKEDTDRIMRMLVGHISGHRKAENLFNLAAAGELSFQGAARLL